MEREGGEGEKRARRQGALGEVSQGLVEVVHGIWAGWARLLSRALCIALNKELDFDGCDRYFLRLF